MLGKYCIGNFLIGLLKVVGVKVVVRMLSWGCVFYFIIEILYFRLFVMRDSC